MIYFFTGLNGSGKTLNALKFVNEDDAFKDRPIYYHYINELKLPWSQLTKDQVHDWQSLPDASVVVVDECQLLYPPRKQGADVPDPLKALTHHRHRGFDFIFITPNPMLVDTALRRLVGRHHHYERIMGTTLIRRFIYGECINDPKDYHARQEAQVDQIKFDKKYFSLYKSAEIHTHKVRLSKQVYIYGIFSLLFFIFLIYAFNRFSNKFSGNNVEQDLQQQTSFSNNYAANSPLSAISSSSSSVVFTSDRFTPAFPSKPFTSPFYAQSVNIISAPRITGCMHYEDDKIDICYCTTQQGTLVDVDKRHCKALLTLRSFDFTLSDDVVLEAEQRYLPTGDPCCS